MKFRCKILRLLAIFHACLYFISRAKFTCVLLAYPCKTDVTVEIHLKKAHTKKKNITFIGVHSQLTNYFSNLSLLFCDL